MIGILWSNLLRLVVLLLAQVLLLDHLDVANGWMVPYLYVLFLLMLPFPTPAWAMLLLGGALGALVDLFNATPGMHTTATLVMAYALPAWRRLLAPREGYEYGLRPVPQDMGFSWWATHAGVPILLHHLWLFIFELHRLDRLPGTFLRALLSALFTLGLCLLVQTLFRGRVRKRA